MDINYVRLLDSDLLIALSRENTFSFIGIVRLFPPSLIGHIRPLAATHNGYRTTGNRSDPCSAVFQGFAAEKRGFERPTMMPTNMQKSSHLVQPKLLLVDDDPSITEAVTAMFEKEGYAVYAVHSGNAAIEETSKGFYHVALVDIKLPDMMGIELLDKLRTVNPRMIVIIVTGYPTLDNAVQALNLGADAYIMKPFDPRGLVLTVKEKVDDNLKTEEMTSKKIAEFVTSRALERGYELA